MEGATAFRSPAMRTPMLALTLALALPAAGDALALTVLDFPPPEGGYTGIRNHETYAIRGTVQTKDLNANGDFNTGFIDVGIDFSTFVDRDGFLFVDVSGFGSSGFSQGVVFSIVSRFGESGEPAFDGNDSTGLGSYAGLNAQTSFSLAFGSSNPEVGAPYEVRFMINPLPPAAFMLMPALLGLAWTRRR